jgi:hypothetical protein
VRAGFMERGERDEGCCAVSAGYGRLLGVVEFPVGVDVSVLVAISEEGEKKYTILERERKDLPSTLPLLPQSPR